VKKNIITYFDVTTKLFPQYHEITTIKKESRKARALRRFDHVVAISESTKRDLHEQYGVPEEKITVSYLGVDAVYDKPIIVGRDDLSAKYKFPADRRYVLSVGTIEPRKNIMGILQSFRIFCDHNKGDDDIMLILSGPMGWKNDTLTKFLNEFPYRDRVIITGYVDLADMPSLYRHAQCLMYLSFYEGFGIPILEAMKSSCPVICSGSSSMPEVLGESGELVSAYAPEEAAEALGRIVRDGLFNGQLRAAGLSRSEKFSWRSHADKLVEIYNAA
jgi:glycosyltransferase involved in cell wall biosynthesis